MNRTINYNFFHWGPFLYKTSLSELELNSVKKLCSKKNKNYQKNLAGLIKHEYVIDVNKVFPIIYPYINSYVQAQFDYSGKPLGTKIELISSWVNYMTKFESNPMHTHDDNLSFVIFTKIPKELREEYNNSIGNTKPGAINFIYKLQDDNHSIDQHIFFPEVGDFFIFPSSLHHFVNSFQCEGERISISGNLKITDG